MKKNEVERFVEKAFPRARRLKDEKSNLFRTVDGETIYVQILSTMERLENQKYKYRFTIKEEYLENVDSLCFILADNFSLFKFSKELIKGKVFHERNVDQRKDIVVRIDDSGETTFTLQGKDWNMNIDAEQTFIFNEQEIIAQAVALNHLFGEPQR